jgi:hypothetical protein
MSWNDYDDYADIRIQRRERQREGPREGQSGIGVISLITSLVTAMLIAVLFALVMIVSLGPNGPPPDDDPKMIMIVLGFLLCLGAALIGLVLGIVGSIQPHRGILCAVFGAVFNGVILVGALLLICAGVMFG